MHKGPLFLNSFIRISLLIRSIQTNSVSLALEGSSGKSVKEAFNSRGFLFIAGFFGFRGELFTKLYVCLIKTEFVIKNVNIY